MGSVLAYKGGYKYQLSRLFAIQTEVFPPEDLATDWGMLRMNGVCVLKKGYSWDGPSGPAIDTDTFMVPSAVHDFGYELIRQGLLGSEWRDQWDREMQRLASLKIRVEGKVKRMWGVRRWWIYNGVSLFAKGAASPRNKRRVKRIEVLG